MNLCGYIIDRQRMSLVLFIDTGIIRSMPRKLERLAREIPLRITAHNYVELIGGIDRNFVKIQSNILAISPIKTDWRLPEDIQASSFKISTQIGAIRSENLRELVDLISSSESFADLSKRASNLPGPFGLDHFLKYSVLYESGNGEDTDRVAALSKTPKRSLLARLSRAEFEKYCFGIVHSLALFSVRSMRPDASDAEVSAAANNYDGSIDTFVRAYGEYDRQKNADAELHARNDMIDLMHLLYLGRHPGDSILMADDHLFSSLASVIPGRCLSSAAVLSSRK